MKQKKKRKVPIGRILLSAAILLGGLYGVRAALAGLAPAPGHTMVVRPVGQSKEDTVYALAQSGLGQMTKVSKTRADMTEGSLILVNRDYACQFPAESALKSVYEGKNDTYQVSNTTVRLQQEALDAFNALFADFQRAKGRTDLLLCSGFRTYDHQKQLLDEKVAQTDAVEAAKWVAQPGRSEHHTGYAADLSIYHPNGRTESYTGTGKYAWLNQNCEKYGIIVRYPEDKAAITGISHEPWHFRYVGEPHAYAMTHLGLCMEEYIDLLRSYPYDGQHLGIQYFDGTTYEVYYVAAGRGNTDVPVPQDQPYTLSGNNVDGFVVTVKIA